MKTYRYIKGIIWVLAMTALSACSNDELFLSGNNKEQTLTFRPVIKQDMESRAIGDATGINQLQVAVYEENEILTKKHKLIKTWSEVESEGIKLTLIEGHSYKILFWAENGNNNEAYKLTDNGRIEIDYTNYLEGGFNHMEELDAFYDVTSITVGPENNVNKEINLTRPLAQLNFADKATTPVEGTHKAIVTFHSIPKALNLLTGEVELTDANDDADDVTFTFEDFPATEILELNNTTYYYVASNYLFAPEETTTIEATLDLQLNDGTSINTFEFKGEKAIPLTKNMKTNVLGNIVQQPEVWSVWDGTAMSEPDYEGDRYIIDAASDLAWLTIAANVETLTGERIFEVNKDIDMNCTEGTNYNIPSLQLLENSTFIGGGKTIKNFANSLFGNATNLTVQNLLLENVHATSDSHVGVLVNTLTGSSSFTGVTITNSSATTSNGAAGGMIGYIARISEKERKEELNVLFSGCNLNDVFVSGSASEGKFVGLLSGYDNNENLTFDAACEATNVSVEDYTSVYTLANNSAWVTDDVSYKYDGWLGHETYRRAKVTFGGVRLAPRWDGTTATAKADLLLYNGESNKYEVHSPFDLAGVRNATSSPSALYLMENVDMFGQGEDGNFFVHSNFTQSAYNSTDDKHFNPFNSIGFLEGNHKGIYNLSINTLGKTDRAAFILDGANGNVHQNISFYNCCTVVPHIVGTETNGQTVDKSYGATVVLSIGGATYNMNNVHAYGCKVFALQKTGIIAGRARATTMATIENCSVNDCYIENYDCKEHQENFEGLVDFYSPGEIGGFIGYIDNFATLKNCHVKGTTIYAFGQNDQRFLLVVTIPGRHVGQFIGDIRTSGKEKDIIKLENCTVDANTKCTKRHDKHNNCNMIGKVYYLNALGIINIDTKGTVTLDGKSIF